MRHKLSDTFEAKSPPARAFRRQQRLVWGRQQRIRAIVDVAVRWGRSSFNFLAKMEPPHWFGRRLEIWPRIPAVPEEPRSFASG